ncbi:MAG: dehydrogenase [Planctomycetes bacterium]|nr:dehydrogenase [Planctomycetota bacterium]
MYAAARSSTGVAPVGLDGKPLNLDFETGDLRDWTATGTAFEGQPIKGDTVRPRRPDSKSEHRGSWWIGTYEPKQTDRAKGTLTSAPFKLTHPYASFLIGGGRRKNTRFELVLADTKAVIHLTMGEARENMSPDLIDLRRHHNAVAFIRLVDDASGGWGHINFDHFRFHTAKPAIKPKPKRVDPATQKTGKPPKVAASIMTVPEGFRVDLVAGEPDLHQPIALALDAKGRIWVAEAYAYPIRRKDSEAKDKIVVFEDTNGDGTHDKRTVFADNLNLVSGLEVGFGGVWVGAAPYLMFIPDKNDDLVPDGPKEILLDGWAWQDTHETLNAFNWGPDGWLYGCHGVFTHSRVGKPGTPRENRTPMNAGVWRYHPIRHTFEIFAWGASNQWGVDFDDHGQAFITACVIPHLYHVAQGGRYQRQAGSHFNPYVFDDIKTIADHRHYLGAKPHLGNGISNSIGGGHAHCGAMIYLGGRFPDKYRNKIFFANVHGNRINMDVPERLGSGFVGRHGKDFLIANDFWFRGINLRYGPDGNVFLIDWYDKQACHHKNPGIWNRTNGRMYKVSYGETTPAAVDLTKKTDAELVSLHLHRNDWYVRHARKLLQERRAGPAVHRALLNIVDGNPDVTRKLRALWTLGATGGLSDADGLRLLASDEEYIRAWTIQLLLEDGKVPSSIMGRLAALARSDPSAVVRLYLASGLQRLPVASRWEIASGLAARSEDARDQNLPLMIWYGVEPLVTANPARAMGLAAISRVPTVTRFIYRRLAADRRPMLDPLCDVLAKVSGERRRLVMDEMLAAFRKRSNVPMPKAWPAVAKRLLAAKERSLVDRAIALAVIFGDRSVLPHLRRTLGDGSAPAERRRTALASLMRVKDQELAPLLHRLLDDAAVRNDAIKSLASFDHAKTAPLLLRYYAKWDADARTAAEKTLASRPLYAKAMLRGIIDKQLPGTILASATTRRLITSLRDAEVDRLMKHAWGHAAPTSKDKNAEIAAWRKKLPPAVLAKADLSHGRAVFAKTCMKCHTLFGIGRTVGPDMTGSNRADLDYILRNILDPNAEVPNDYLVTNLMVEDGRIIVGIVAEENDQTLTIKTENETLVIAKSDIDLDDNGKPQRWRPNTSMMPGDQLQAMSQTDVRDLIAYLASPVQVPMEVDDTNVLLFFNGKDLTGWDGDQKLWSVQDGEIVGRTATGLKRNEFLSSHLLVGDFRLTLEAKLLPNAGNSGIQIRSQRVAGGMKGLQADMGAGWWGKLYDEHGRGLLWDKPGDAHVRAGEWNTYEILAVGGRVWTAINGQPCVNLDDPKGPRRGLIAFQLHSGGPTEVRFRKLKLELKPAAKLNTVDR